MCLFVRSSWNSKSKVSRQFCKWRVNCSQVVLIDLSCNSYNLFFYLCQVYVNFSIFGRSSQVFTLDESFYSFLDYHWRWQETALELCCHIRNQQIVLKLNQNNSKLCLNHIYLRLTESRLRDFMILTIAASISCLRSSSTLLRVSRRSGSVSPLAATV